MTALRWGWRPLSSLNTQGPVYAAGKGQRPAVRCLPSALGPERPGGAGAHWIHPAVCSSRASCFLLLCLHVVPVLKDYKPPGRSQSKQGSEDVSVARQGSAPLQR